MFKIFDLLFAEGRHEILRQCRMDSAMESIDVMLEASRDLVALHSNSPRPRFILKRSELWGEDFIWEIPLRDRPPVYMGISPTKAKNDLYVVQVGMASFYGAWRASAVASSSDPAARPPRPRDIPTDCKWTGQGQNWAGGVAKPVTLAEVGYDASVGIRFVAGTTRTLWLAHHGAASFPLIVRDMESALDLHNHVGDPLRPAYRVSELLEHEQPSEVIVY